MCYSYSAYTVVTVAYWKGWAQVQKWRLTRSLQLAGIVELEGALGEFRIAMSQSPIMLIK